MLYPPHQKFFHLQCNASMCKAFKILNCLIHLDLCLCLPSFSISNLVPMMEQQTVEKPRRMCDFKTDVSAFAESVDIVNSGP